MSELTELERARDAVCEAAIDWYLYGHTSNREAIESRLNQSCRTVLIVREAARAAQGRAE